MRIEGKKILEFKGIVFGEVVAGVKMFKDMLAAFLIFLAVVLVVIK